MPFYEYECSSCKYSTEIMQKISDTPLKKCPSCSRSTLKKLISAPVFRLKGAGWYETDFKSDKENKRNLAGEEKGSEDTKTEAKTETKSEDKPEKKPEAKPAVKKTKPARKPAAAKTKKKQKSR